MFYVTFCLKLQVVTVTFCNIPFLGTFGHTLPPPTAGTIGDPCRISCYVYSGHFLIRNSSRAPSALPSGTRPGSSIAPQASPTTPPAQAFLSPRFNVLEPLLLPRGPHATVSPPTSWNGQSPLSLQVSTAAYCPWEVLPDCWPEISHPQVRVCNLSCHSSVLSLSPREQYLVHFYVCVFLVSSKVTGSQWISFKLTGWWPCPLDARSLCSCPCPTPSPLTGHHFAFHTPHFLSLMKYWSFG